MSKWTQRWTQTLIEDVGVYNVFGDNIKPDDLPNVLYPGQAVIVNVEP